jgi:hypothetical protein
MIKVEITEVEWFPVFVVEVIKSENDNWYSITKIPEATLERYKKVMAEFNAVQDELRELKKA